MRVAVVVIALSVMGSATEASAEWHVKPFLGMAFGGGTTFVDVEDAAGSPTEVLGVSGVLLGDVVGLDIDFSHAPGFFESGNRDLVVHSSVTTLTGSVVVALPRHLNEYGLRPYLVGGAGLMRVRIEHRLNVLDVADTVPAIQLGGGVTGFLTDRIGLSWEVRHFRTVRGTSVGRGLSFGPERLSFWRGTMALVIGC